MGFGDKLFFVEDDGSIIPVTAARFRRIFNGEEILARYAGRRVRYAHVMVQLEDRKLTGWYREWYNLLPFDGTGKVDKDEELRGAGLAMEAMPFPTLSPGGKRDHPNVVEARGKFAQREFGNLFKWEPDLKLRTRILGQALGRKPRRPERRRTNTPPPSPGAATVARRWVQEIWADRNLFGFDALHAADFVDRSPSGRGTDRTAYRAGIEELFKAFPDFRASTEDLVVNETAGKVAVRWTAVETHQGPFLDCPATGRRVFFSGIEILRIENGRIVERWGEWDGLDLLRQLQW